jgi:hypothetical protein
MNDPGIIENADGTITIEGKTGLPAYVIYDHPRDYPNHFVVRPHLLDDRRGKGHASPNGFLFDTLKQARDFIPKGMVRVQRHPTDDSVIVESYI